MSEQEPFTGLDTINARHPERMPSVAVNHPSGGVRVVQLTISDPTTSLALWLRPAGAVKLADRLLEASLGMPVDVEALSKALKIIRVHAEAVAEKTHEPYASGFAKSVLDEIRKVLP